MNLFLELRESDLGLGGDEDYAIAYRLRKAARAIVFNDENKIALMHVSAKGYHKLPGGGLELGESTEQGLVREIREEVGADIIILDEVGMVVEYRNTDAILQFSYCYFARVFGELYAPSYDAGEQEEGFELLWVSLDDAIEIISKDIVHGTHRIFIRERDKRILLEAKRILENIG